jgi:hypothetical protein
VKSFRRLLPLALFWAAVTAYYVFVSSAGLWTSWPTWSSLYDEQAEGFRAGHLYLREPASPQLKSLANPWDPANMRYWRWDHSYYGGHLYLYWGLVPAVLVAGIKTVLRIRGSITDDMLVFAFASVRLVAGTLLLRALARRLPAPPSGWAVWLAMFVFALASPLPYALNRGAVYEAAILGGCAFLCLGLWFGQATMFAPHARSAAPGLAAASSSFGLAAGSRISLMPTAVALTLLMILARSRTDARAGRIPPPRTWLAAGAPAAAVILVHLVLNQLRFGSWREFGGRYQMGFPVDVGVRFFLVDLYGYFFSPPTFSCQFPFLSAMWRSMRGMAPAWLPWPVDHRAEEPLIGMLVVAPFTALGTLGPLVLVARWLWRRRMAAPPLVVPGREVWPWIWTALGVSVLGGALPLMFISGATMRYQLDFSSGLLIISSLVGWHLLALPTTRTGRLAVTTLYALLAAVTIGAGLLLGFGGYTDHFGRHNPALLRSLQAAFSLCGGP